MRNLKLVSLPGLLVLAGVFVAGLISACVVGDDPARAAKQAEIDQINFDVYQTFISN